MILHLLISALTAAQPLEVMNAAEIKIALKKINVLGSVLYIAAHPDDENTAALSYFSTEKSLRTGYLAITRGDGGQNLIGSEQGDLLGLLRTNELLQARKVDGAEQFFTRAIDFGYSKSPEETFKIWEKQKVLSDVVWVIRKFKPDIIITRFPANGDGGHGHHTASAILAEEAFDIANDPAKFPEQLHFVSPWQPKALYWNSWRFPSAETVDKKSQFITIDFGKYNKLLGKSYSEISALSRTFHKSQGFGSSGRRGETLNYFEFVKGEKSNSDLFEKIDLTWDRVPSSKRVKELLSKAEKDFIMDDPSTILPILIEAYNEVQKLPSNYWKDVKLNELKNIIRSCSGIWLECISPNKFYALGDSINFSCGIVNRSDYPIILKKIKSNFVSSEVNVNKKLNDGNFYTEKISTIVPKDWKLTNPYWLEKSHKQGMYEIENLDLVGKADYRNELTSAFILSFNGTEIEFETPIYFRWTDPVDGEKYDLCRVTPPVSIKLINKTLVFPNHEKKELRFSILSHADNLEGTINIKLPENWKSHPNEIHFNLQKKDEEKEFSFIIEPSPQSSSGKLTFNIQTNKGSSDREIIQMNYSHFLPQTYFPKADVKLVSLDIIRQANQIGYVMGAGDQIPEYLRQIGFNVTLLSDEDLELQPLNNYDAIITGIRAYNTRDKLRTLNTNLLNYVHEGGTLVVQYNVNRGLITDQIGPYPFSISRDRVTEENSKVNFTDKNSRLLNFPNRINQEDFDNWVQERGLYFTEKWDNRYRTVLTCKDNGETEKSGSLLIANYGKGVFIYTGLTFFRQLPEGVPGAYKLFTNLISAKQN